MATKIKTPADWASAQLGELGIPNNATDDTNLVTWWQHEGGAGPQFGVANNDDNYNPINTTLDQPGAVSTNSSGVKSYKSWSQGLLATGDTLQEPAYSKVLNDLVNDTNYQTFSQDVTASGWGTDLDGTTADPKTTPSQNSYDTGVDATNNSGSAANSPGTTTGAQVLPGLGGVLQGLDALYSPAEVGPNWDPSTWISFIPKDIESTTVMVFVRATSSILAIGLILMGIKTFLNASGGGGSSGNNVLEFVNNAKVSNAKIGQAGERITASAEKEANVGERHAQRLSDKERDRQSRERVAQTPKVNFHFKKSQSEEYKESHIYHHTTPKADNKAAKERGLRP